MTGEPLLVKYVFIRNCKMSDKTKEGISFDSKMDDVFQKNVNDLLTIKEDFAESDLILLDLVEHDPESAL